MRPAELQKVGSVEVEPHTNNGEYDEVQIDLGLVYIFTYVCIVITCTADWAATRMVAHPAHVQLIVDFPPPRSRSRSHPRG